MRIRLDSRLGNCSMHCPTSCIPAVVRGNDEIYISVSFRSNNMPDDLTTWLLSAREHQVVAVDELRFIDVAEQLLDTAAGLAGNPG
mgnify:CR=1 FL=1